jgi:hypothetical protein
MDNLGNPFLNPKMNDIEIYENEAYKGKATICSPSIEVESVIGSILEVNDEDQDEEYNDDDEAFENNIQNLNIIPEPKKDTIGEEDKENMDYNIMNNHFLKINKNSDNKNTKSNNVVSSVTSFRKYSLPTSSLSKMSDENKYLQKSKSGNRQNGPFTPLNSNNNSNLKSNGNETTINNKSYHNKNKRYERILAVHDYKARDNREMTLEKGDILIVKQRQGSWIYCVKESNIFKLDIITNQPIKFEHREHGWVPSTYIKPYNNNKYKFYN